MMATDQGAGHPHLDGKPHAASRDAGPASRAAIIQGSPEAAPVLSQGSRGARRCQGR
jgi:hypothetical protein